jgi:hypothetical protein
MLGPWSQLALREAPLGKGGFRTMIPILLLLPLVSQALKTQ